MNGLELQARREALGMTHETLTKLLHTDDPAWLQNIEQSQMPVPEMVRTEIEMLEERYEDLLDLAILGIEEAFDQGADEAVLYTYPTDEQLWQAQPDLDGTPAVLHRVACARAVTMNPHPIEIRIENG